jgi:MFS family permease
MKITGSKRWILLVMISIFSGTMVLTPYLRFNFYDQIVILLTQSNSIVDASRVNEYIGDLALVFGTINMIMYIIGGILVDKYGEKAMLIIGGLLMGAGSILYGLVLSKTALMIGFVLFGFGTGTLFNGYLKLTRKLGNSEEQGRMYSASEFFRGITGTIIGLIGVSMLNQAVLPSGVTDPALIGERWKILLFLHAGIYFVIVILCFIMIPNNVVGAEEDAVAAEPFTFKGALSVLKMPGTWLTTGIVFFGYSITACASGYLGAYTSNIIGVSASQAATFATIRNYFIAAISTLVIGFVAAKLKSESKTIGIYGIVSGVLIVAMLLLENNFVMSIACTFVFAAAYTGMRGLYFAVPSETGIPVQLTGVANGVISTIGYLPDVFFAKLAGGWLDSYGLDGYRFIWYWAIGCSVLVAVVSFISYKYTVKRKKRQVIL